MYNTTSFYGYHAVTERPMSLGQHIIYDDNHHSGVYERVMSKAAIIEDIYNNPEKYAHTDFDYPVVVALREFALEEVRKKFYPYYPSRMACLYVSETIKEAAQWAEYFISIGRPTFQIVKLKITGYKFTGNAANCFDASADREENLRLAERYWKNENTDDKPPINEILVSGEITVEEIIKQYI